MRREHGFTLIEVMVATAIMVIVVAAIVAAYVVASRGASEATRIGDAQMAGRRAFAGLSDEMRGAVGGAITITTDAQALGSVIQFQREFTAIPGTNITVRYYVRAGVLRTGQGTLPDRMLVRQEFHPATLMWTDRVRNPLDGTEQPSDPGAPWDVIARYVHAYHEGKTAEQLNSGFKVTPATSGVKEYVLAATIRVPGSRCPQHWANPAGAGCDWAPKKICQELNRVTITQVSIRN